MVGTPPTVKLDLNSDQMGARPYHHGDLREALLAAAESVLRERGVEGFSLREAARRAGVSPGAPAHHFKDVRGLFTAVATRAFEDLARALAAADSSGPADPKSRLIRQGRAYVAFARARPESFDLMWRCALLDARDPALSEAGARAIGLLAAATGAPPQDPATVAPWALVHGFARLAGDGAFDSDAPGLLDGVLDWAFSGPGPLTSPRPPTDEA